MKSNINSVNGFHSITKPLDLIDVLTSFCARLYGKRAAKNRAMRALEATKDEGI